MTEYENNLNSQANVRDYLMNFINTLPITTSNSIKLQSSSIVQLTQSTNQLTRTTLIIALEKCLKLSIILHSISSTISYEDASMITTQLLQCASNILTVTDFFR